MKNLFRKLALTATTVAVAAGTITATAGSASAAGNDLELPPNLQRAAMTECATPQWTPNGDFQPGSPQSIYVANTGKAKSDDGSVIGHWAWVFAYSPTGGQTECLVAQIEEPEGLAKDGRAVVGFQTVGGATNLDLAVLNPNFSRSADEEKYSHTQSGATAYLGTEYGTPFVDTDNDPTTPRVADFGAHLRGHLPLQGVTAAFIVAGTKLTTETITSDKTVTVKRTQVERDKALKIKRDTDKRVHTIHDKAARKVSKAKSAARAEVNQNKKLSKKAKKAALKRVDAKFKKQQRALSAECVKTRKDVKAAYKRAIAPYKKTVKVSSDKVTKTPFNEVAVTQIEDFAD